MSIEIVELKRKKYNLEKWLSEDVFRNLNWFNLDRTKNYSIKQLEQHLTDKTWPESRLKEAQGYLEIVEGYTDKDWQKLYKKKKSSDDKKFQKLCYEYTEDKKLHEQSRVDIQKLIKATSDEDMISVLNIALKKLEEAVILSPQRSLYTSTYNNKTWQEYKVYILMIARESVEDKTSMLEFLVKQGEERLRFFRKFRKHIKDNL